MASRQKPSALLLVLLHNVLLIVCMLYGVGGGPFAVLAFLCLLIALFISGVYHLILWLLTRKRHIGNYTMKMKIEDNLWRVSILDKSGRQMYRDKHSDFVGNLSVYWAWDKADRLWLYNSDDGWIYYWVLTPEGWRRACWTQQQEHKKPAPYAPPDTLFPDYAKKATQ